MEHRAWTIGAWRVTLWTSSAGIRWGFMIGRATGRFPLVCAHVGRLYVCASRHEPPRFYLAS